jgi:biopolymer transport protein ExbB/TolQ
LRIRFAIDGRRLFNEVKKYLAVNDHKRALDVCRQYPLVPLAQVLGAGIANMKQSIEEVDVAMESEALYYIPKINQRISFLPSLANTATLIGLLGTITGLIVAFSGSGGQALGGYTKEQIMAHGISIAMYTTAFALMVAIPTVLMGMYLSNRANQLVDDIDHYASSLKHLIQRMKSGQTLDSEAREELKAPQVAKANPAAV